MSVKKKTMKLVNRLFFPINILQKYFIQIMPKKEISRLILIVSLLAYFVVSGPSCMNQYTQTNLPGSCTQLNRKCTITNVTSLIVNTNTTNQTFIVCLNLPTYLVSLENGSDVLDLSVYIQAASINLVSYSITTAYDIVLISTTILASNSSNLTAHLVWMQSKSVSLYSSILKLQELFDTSCNCLDKGASCQVQPYYFPFLYSSLTQSAAFNMKLMNYTYDTWNFFGANVNSILLTANNSINIVNSTLRISVIGMYSPFIYIQSSSINTTGLGFPSGTGYGCGYFNEVLNQLLSCSGTGGSYGGFGGNSSPQGCNLLFSNLPYSRQLIPKYPGSGGGFFLREVTEVSSGGGVINMQGQNIDIQRSYLLSNGVGGIQGGGGGAGGSISIDFYVFTSNQSTATANGGAGRSSGSGGRIRFWDQNWQTYSTASISNMNIEVSGGGQCDSSLTCGLNGSIISAPCPPGYETNLTTLTCQQCSNGTYQLVYGYGKCFPCKSRPQDSYYEGQNNSNFFSNYSQVCKFQCNEGYKQYNNRECLTNFQIALVNVGGYNLLISFGIIIASLIIFLIITMVRKLSYNDSNTLEENQHIDYYKKKSYFKIQDIPFHQIRIYFEGENTPEKPWKISENVQDNLKEFYQDNEEKVLIITRLIRQLNEISEYPRGLSAFLFALKIFYYPLSLVFAEAFREQKSKNVRRAVIAKAKNLSQDSGVKFHVNQFYTVGCLQIFNYHKQTLDFYIKNYFPIYFKLQRLLIGGYSIDNTDPLLKALYSQFQDRGSKKLQKFLIQLNQLLRSEDITVYKHLWKITEIYPVLQCYLWQPPKIVGENQLMPVQAQQNGVMGMENRFTINKDMDLFLVFCIEGKSQINHSLMNPINISQLQQNKMAQCKFSKHFYYVTDLPNIYYDEIACIRHKYNLREAMIEYQEKRNVFWEIQNGFSQKYLSWALGSISILSLLLNLLAFFIFVFLLVELREALSIYALLTYFIIFPFCQFFMIVSEFKLIISKGYKTIAYSIYFTLFTIIKNITLIVILILVGITFGFQDVAFFILFLIWIFLLILQVVSLVLLCMLNARITKAK